MQVYMRMYMQVYMQVYLHAHLDVHARVHADVHAGVHAGQRSTAYRGYRSTINGVSLIHIKHQRGIVDTDQRSTGYR